MNKQEPVQAGKNLLSKKKQPVAMATPKQMNSQNDPDNPIPLDSRRYIRIGAFIVLFGFGGFGLWAVFAQLGSAVISQGEVVLESYRKTIQHYEGGIVENIAVRDGDLVQKGDLLVQLDTTQWQGEMRSSSQNMFSSLIELERLQHEQQLAEKLEFSDRVLAAAAESADLQSVLVQQKRLYTARIESYTKEQQTLASRMQQTLAVVRGLEQQRKLLEEQIQLINKEQEAYATLQDERLGDGMRARELARQGLSLRNEAARLKADQERTLLQASEVEVQLASNQQNFQKEVGERIRTAQNNYFEAQERFLVMQDKVSRSSIRAPEAGYIVNMQLHTLGGITNSGQDILDLVPMSDNFVVEARIQIQDINSVFVGQKSDIRFPAFDQRTTPSIEGEVVHISADSLTDKQTGMNYYLTRVRVTENGAESLAKLKLIPGMPAEVMLRRESRTFLSYLMKPLADSFTRSFKEK
ncbi:MAG TPA: HlyD family type I secretion periplasmic adaptor subunit [Marinospirillum sp.]|uniref:HlyD family type I secretion periplasmic adaptor subunit n=1 Tax=Marinospirillum sp. TaxID=2183934 RepID=UPI002B46B5D9|nr:HlyD family type I secretion periplasmic adaptor subunit [Marinospirillum sp.]HKM15988.1 HlyD family type I secretion periplasmic adaptor subunit [Marinospirillum sp.]